MLPCCRQHWLPRTSLPSARPQAQRQLQLSLEAHSRYITSLLEGSDLKARLPPHLAAGGSTCATPAAHQGLAEERDGGGGGAQVPALAAAAAAVAQQQQQQAQQQQAQQQQQQQQQQQEGQAAAGKAAAASGGPVAALTGGTAGTASLTAFQLPGGGTTPASSVQVLGPEAAELAALPGKLEPLLPLVLGADTAPQLQPAGEGSEAALKRQRTG